MALGISAKCSLRASAIRAVHPFKSVLAGLLGATPENCCCC
jgi:hypothetical protein